MDEFTFRTSQKLDNLQYQLRIVAGEGKNALQQLSNQTKNTVTQVLSSSKAEELRASARKLYIILIEFATDAKQFIITHYNPRVIIANISKILGKRITKRDVLIGGLGLIIGSFIGFCVATYSIQTKRNTFRCMQAVQCLSYSGIKSVSVVEDAIVPNQCGKNEVLINVKSASVNPIDVEITNGYGSLIRSLLSRYDKMVQYYRDVVPVTLGRDCTGTVMEVGQDVSRLEIGDEVWLTVPFWAHGTLAQYIMVPESKVSLKPSISFEAACSLPYSGSLALCALEEANITAENAKNKKILIHGGCSPVGCVLIQILTSWGAGIITTCYRKALPVAFALGVKDAIVLSPSLLKNETSSENCSILLKTELQNSKFDVIIVTTNCELSEKELRNFCNIDGVVVSTLPQVLKSDSYGFFMAGLYSLQVRIKCVLQKVLTGKISLFGEREMSYHMLDKLSEFIEKGQLRSVVDRVFQPHEIEQALMHIQSPESIGSSVISFG